ncbi:hypothetical protein [Paraglaciecola aestuariivivens]
MGILMRVLSKIITILLIMLAFSNANAKGIIVVANTELANVKIEKRQLRDVFMKNNTQFKLVPLTLSPANNARLIFNTKVVGLTESRIQSYWAQMRFGGKKQPPLEFETVDSLLAYLKSHKNTVAYLPDNIEVPENLTIIYRVE